MAKEIAKVMRGQKNGCDKLLRACISCTSWASDVKQFDNLYGL